MSRPDRQEPMDWSLTTWEGAQRETMRRWAAAPLERIVAALEEMEAWSAVMGGDGQEKETAGNDPSATED